jgi:hypothetical protein
MGSKNQFDNSAVLFTLITEAMPSPKSGIKIDTSQFETPFTIRQVETHLIFGPIARYVSLAYLVLGGGIVCLIVDLCSTHKPLGQYIGGNLDKAFFLLLPVLLLRITRRQQAIIGWIAVKFCAGTRSLYVGDGRGRNEFPAPLCRCMV